jgi:hypothetical protein
MFCLSLYDIIILSGSFFCFDLVGYHYPLVDIVLFSIVGYQYPLVDIVFV